MTISSQIGQCPTHNPIELFRNNPFNAINRTLALLLFVLGLVGNTLGIYVSAGKTHTKTLSPTPRVTACTRSGRAIRSNDSGQLSVLANYLLRWYYGVNLVNTLLLAISPIMKLYGWQGHKGSTPKTDDVIKGRYSAQMYGVWSSKAWVTYIAKYHYPISKPLVSFGLLVYLAIFAKQLLAVVRPHSYNSLVTKANLNKGLAIALIYCTVWYVPTYLWFDVRADWVCDLGGNAAAVNYDVGYKDQTTSTTSHLCTCHGHVIYVYDWTHRPRQGANYWVWEAYQFVRELLVNVVPVFVVVSLKILILKHRSKVAHLSQMSEMNPPTNIERVTINNSSIGNSALNKGSDFKDVAYSGGRNIGIRLDSGNGRNDEDFSRVIENRQRMRTLIIFTLEFVFLMLPSTIFQMGIDSWRHRFDDQAVFSVFILVMILQHIYISCTFYINFAFNKSYRKVAIARISQCLNFWKK